jgi:chemotaxis protein histidine kinase CheA
MAKSISTKGSKKKSTPKKKATGSKTAQASAKAVQQAEKPEEDMASPDSAARPLSISELVLKKFDGWHPPQMFIPPADDSPAPVAPPFVSADDPQEAERITALLFRTFDLKADIASYEAERVAAEKAEAERVAAEKAEAERLAAEKAEAERVAAEKAEAERVAAEKAEAERLAAEKAEAERLAAEKAEAERLAAEKAEAERLAAEKAEVERLAAENAEAERIAAEQRKKAIKAQQAEIPKVTTANLQETSQSKEPEPMNSAVKLAAGGVGLLIILLLGFSFSNSHNYYLKPVKNGVEIWQGRFAPKGEKRLIALPGVQVSKTLHGVCTQDVVYPVIFKYYLDKADAIISKPGIPDFEGIKHMIALAQPYAITRNLRNEAALRLNRMEQAMLEYKADIAASKGDAADLKTALDLLDKAKALNIDSQSSQLDVKIADITARLKNQKTAPASMPAGK